MSSQGVHPWMVHGWFMDGPWMDTVTVASIDIQARCPSMDGPWMVRVG